MTKQELLSVFTKAFKSLNPSQIEILELDGPLIHVRIISDQYSELITERVELLTDLLRDESEHVSLNYAISFEPFTPSEYDEFFPKI